MKIIHTADVHLDAPLRSFARRNDDLRERVGTATRAAFQAIVDLALDEGAVAVLIAGDLFDGAHRNASTAVFLTRQFDRLQAAGVRVFIIKGNHDAAHKLIDTVDAPPNVKLFDARGGVEQLAEDVFIHGVSFAGAQEPVSLLPKFGPPQPGAVNIGLLHTSLAGAPGHDVYAPTTRAALKNHGFDYWALGHVHKRAIHCAAPWIVMPGTPQGRDIGEDGRKSATLITIENGRIAIEDRPTAALAFDRLDIPIAPTDDGANIRAALRTGLEGAAAALNADTGVFRLRLTGRPADPWRLRADADVWREAADDIAEEVGPLFIEKLTFAFDAPVEALDGAPADLDALIANLSTEPDMIATLDKRIEEVRAALPPHARSSLAASQEDREALRDALIAEGRIAWTTRLRGTPS